MFNGFTPETVDFLWGIRLNNNRDWFMAHKPDYVQHLYEPMKALGAELFTPFIDVPGQLLKVSRIYRDARMHHDLPYKESLWICIRPNVEWWMENPCLFFEITPDGISYGLLWWKPRPQTMKDLRQHIAAEPKTFLKLVRAAEKATGLPITAREYKRPPMEAPSDALAPYFAWRDQILCIREEAFSEATFGPELSERVGKFLEALTPLYTYLCQFTV